MLVWIGLIATLLLAASAAFRPSWPVAAIYVVLLLNGFFQSLQFMAYNTIAYADVPRPQMSTATSFYTTFQQMSLTLGIAISAAVLARRSEMLGHAGSAHCRISPWRSWLWQRFRCSRRCSASRLDKSAGAELSGHRDRPAKPRLAAAE